MSLQDINDLKDKQATCKHQPVCVAGFVGQTTTCALCGCALMFNNNGYGTRNRMSKKERRAAKELTKRLEAKAKAAKEELKML